MDYDILYKHVGKCVKTYCVTSIIILDNGFKKMQDNNKFVLSDFYCAYNLYYIL